MKLNHKLENEMNLVKRFNRKAKLIEIKNETKSLLKCNRDMLAKIMGIEVLDRIILRPVVNTLFDSDVANTLRIIAVAIIEGKIVRDEAMKFKNDELLNRRVNKELNEMNLNDFKKIKEFRELAEAYGMSVDEFYELISE